MAKAWLPSRRFALQRICDDGTRAIGPERAADHRALFRYVEYRNNLSTMTVWDNARTRWDGEHSVPRHIEKSLTGADGVRIALRVLGRRKLYGLSQSQIAVLVRRSITGFDGRNCK